MHNESLYVGHTTSVETWNCILQRQSSQPQTPTYKYNPQKQFKWFICDCPYWAIKWDSIKDNWTVDTILTQHGAIKLHLHKTLFNRNKSISFSPKVKFFVLSKTFQYLSWKTNVFSIFVKQKFGFLALVKSGCHTAYISEPYYFNLRNLSLLRAIF